MECHHDDYELVIHSTGEVKKMEDIDWDQMMEWMVAANVENHRCIFENDEIIVEHQIISSGSGDRETLMLVHQLTDGLMWRTESGATPLPSKSCPTPDINTLTFITYYPRLRLKS